MFLVWIRLVLGAAVLLALAARRGALAPLRGRAAAAGRARRDAGRDPVRLADLRRGAHHVVADRHPRGGVADLHRRAGDRRGRTRRRGSRRGRWAGSASGSSASGCCSASTCAAASCSAALMVLGTALGYSLGALYLRRHFLGVPSLGRRGGVDGDQRGAGHADRGAAAPGGDAVARRAGGGGGARRARHRHRVLDLLHADRRGRARPARRWSPTWRRASPSLYGAVFLDEPVSGAAIGGLALILAGSWLAAEGRAPWRSRPVPVPA